MHVLDVEGCVGFSGGSPGLEVGRGFLTVLKIIEALLFLAQIGSQTFLVAFKRGWKKEEALELHGLTGLGVADLHDKVQGVPCGAVQTEKIHGALTEEVIPFEGIVGFQEGEGIPVRVCTLFGGSCQTLGTFVLKDSQFTTKGIHVILEGQKLSERRLRFHKGIVAFIGFREIAEEGHVGSGHVGRKEEWRFGRKECVGAHTKPHRRTDCFQFFLPIKER